MDSDASEVYILSFEQKKKRRKKQLKSSGKQNSFDSLRAAHAIIVIISPYLKTSLAD